MKAQYFPDLLNLRFFFPVLAIEAGSVSFFFFIIIISFLLFCEISVRTQHAQGFSTNQDTQWRKERMEGSGIDGVNGKVCESESAVWRSATLRGGGWVGRAEQQLCV